MNAATGQGQVLPTAAGVVQEPRSLGGPRASELLERASYRIPTDDPIGP